MNVLLVPQDERPIDVIRFQHKEEFLIGYGLYIFFLFHLIISEQAQRNITCCCLCSGPSISIGQLELNTQNAAISLNMTDGALFISPSYGIILLSQLGLTTLYLFFLSIFAFILFIYLFIFVFLSSFSFTFF
jgi:hypothetical protein